MSEEIKDLIFRVFDECPTKYFKRKDFIDILDFKSKEKHEEEVKKIISDFKDKGIIEEVVRIKPNQFNKEGSVYYRLTEFKNCHD